MRTVRGSPYCEAFSQSIFFDQTSRSGGRKRQGKVGLTQRDGIGRWTIFWNFPNWILHAIFNIIITLHRNGVGPKITSSNPVFSIKRARGNISPLCRYTIYKLLYSLFLRLLGVGDIALAFFIRQQYLHVHVFSLSTESRFTCFQPYSAYSVDPTSPLALFLSRCSVVKTGQKEGKARCEVYTLHTVVRISWYNYYP